MALTVHPADGLIHRLLQQKNQSKGVQAAGSGKSELPRDYVRISGDARQQSPHASENSASSLGDRLLQLYRRNGQSS